MKSADTWFFISVDQFGVVQPTIQLNVWKVSVL